MSQPLFVNLLTDKMNRRMVHIQPCPTLCDPVNCSPPGSSVQGISQARILEWVAIYFSRGSPQLRDQTQVSCIAGRFFTTEPPGKPKCMVVLSLLFYPVFPGQTQTDSQQ